MKKNVYLVMFKGNPLMVYLSNEAAQEWCDLCNADYNCCNPYEVVELPCSSELNKVIIQGN